MARNYSIALVKRFATSARQDGVLSAMRKTRGYLQRRFFRAKGTVGQPVNLPHSTDEHKSLLDIWRTLARNQAFHVTTVPAISRKRRQIAMIGDLNLPQCRKYRVEQMAEFWRARGVGFEFAHFQDTQRATRILQHATHLMEYRLQAQPLTEMLRYEARRLRLPVLYDLDDPLFSVAAYETYGNMDALNPAQKSHFVAEAPSYLSMMNGADAVSVSTPKLASEVSKLCARQVFVRRNFADEETLVAGAAAFANCNANDGLFRVAFASGSNGHEADLSQIYDPLSKFITADQNRRLLILGHFDKTSLPIALRNQSESVAFTSYKDYLYALARANCAVVPLQNDQFNQCKSAVRVIDASAVGVPSIVGPIGDFTTVVEHLKTGFVAQSRDGWLQALRMFAGAQNQGREMGLAARKNLERNWAGRGEPHIIDPALLAWVEE